MSNRNQNNDITGYDGNIICLNGMNSLYSQLYIVNCMAISRQGNIQGDCLKRPNFEDQ